MILTYIKFIEEVYEKRIERIKLAGMEILSVAYAVIAIAGLREFFRGNQSTEFVSIVPLVYHLIIALFSILLIVDRQTSRNVENQKAIAAFGWLYFLWCMSIIILPRIHYNVLTLVLYDGFLLTFALFPLLWFKKVFLKRHLFGVVNFYDRKGFQQFCKKNGITDREWEIIEFMLRGKSNQEIKKDLDISIYTVKNHIHNIYSKTGVGSRPKLAQKLVEFFDNPVLQ